MTRTVLACLLILAGCAQPAAPPSPPTELQTCPSGRTAPPPPPAPRTVKSLVDWVLKVNAALVATEKARSECARRLGALNTWITENTRGNSDGRLRELHAADSDKGGKRSAHK